MCPINQNYSEKTLSITYYLLCFPTEILCTYMKKLYWNQLPRQHVFPNLLPVRRPSICSSNKCLFLNLRINMDLQLPLGCHQFLLVDTHPFCKSLHQAVISVDYFKGASIREKTDLKSMGSQEKSLYHQHKTLIIYKL
jgi:hypothetical protein